MSNIITNNESAVAVVKMVKAQMRNETGKYAEYVAANNVTPENIAKHVKALRELAFPGIKADGRAEIGTPERDAKRFADKVRLGLRTAAGDAPSKRKDDAIDWIAKIIEDIDKGTEAGVDAAAIRDAVNAHVKSLLS